MVCELDECDMKMEVLLTLKRPTGASEAQVPTLKLPVPFNFHQISTMLSVFLENIVLNIPL